MAANLASGVWFKAFATPALPLLLPGLVATGAAVAMRPGSAAVLGLAAVSGFLGWWAFQAWDSAQLMVGVLSAVAGFAAVVVLLPRAIQRVIVSVMIVLHFVGILSAVSSVPPTPALMNWAWTYLYRPYLQFMYLNNAYHFYSPEPGPGILVWFYVRYDDGSTEWYKIPDRAENPLAQEYQRRLSLAESTNQLLQIAPIPEEIRRRRLAAFERDGIPLYPPTLDLNMQRREPNPFSKEMLKNYARYVAHFKARQTGKTVSGVKVYRVVHNLPTPKEIAEGIDPTEKNFYYPYFQGEFTADGQLKDKDDPYLYWLIPIIKTTDPKAFREGKLPVYQPDEGRPLQLLDLLEVHAELPTESTPHVPPNFVPGEPGPAQRKNTLLDPAAASLHR
ncbi:MAG TPA: hypothetical protein VKU02_30110 [Gemmataceae bacterium]|nr:hypothetical protein [Gemmataceae bacterium]